MNQEQMSAMNQRGWNQAAYRAWVNRHGLPSEYAEILKQEPEKSVRNYLPYMGDVRGKKIANLLGSKGNKAVSFALFGADVTVVDFSQENQQYALELAESAGVKIKYIVSDVLAIPDEEKLADFDYIILELGVLHYFMELNSLFELIYDALKPGGMFILREYHPFAVKVVNQGERGNYFNQEIEEGEVAYSILLSEEERQALEKTLLRRWTLGEIVTAIVQSGLQINSLEEEKGVRWAFPEEAPKGIEERIPGLFTLIARK
ncbi:class I SAM-dependent methyltransferase [Bacillus sp. FJAT-49736]|uniref:class I SAM-dependent methyltransferase n=1 Tax=Bacillus sp. FJAT-49736 TaxID=2833582 RepID=UPI001BCA3837|nr:class I SAM-dependent methyltransferase [Bacillus sp. FJAT-49736]MBS4174378.1 class I SAM-dependent methyltransferase [Bacillus sp. FJAT-49736]